MIYIHNIYIHRYYTYDFITTCTTYTNIHNTHALPHGYINACSTATTPLLPVAQEFGRHNTLLAVPD